MSLENIKQKAYLEAAKFNKNINYEQSFSRYKVEIVDNVLLKGEIIQDNALVTRQQAVKYFIEEILLGITQPINATFLVELNDVLYENESVACFSTYNKINMLIPDLYAMGNYSDKLSIKDTIPLAKKLKMAFFIGASTGKVSVSLNERLKVCNKYRNNSIIKCYINNICQVDMDHVKNVYPHYNDFVHHSVSISDQHKYKYLINIDGNTSAWDRVPWILNSNSVLLMKTSNSKCWYYDYLKPYVHYIPFDDETDLEEIVNSVEDRSHIIRNANEFVRNYLSHDKHKLYMRHFLEAISN